MTRYTNFKMRITEDLTFSDLHGEEVIALTNSQLDRLVKAYEEKKVMTI